MGVYDIVEIDIICPYCKEPIELQTKNVFRLFEKIKPGDYVYQNDYFHINKSKKPSNFIVEAHGHCRDCEKRYKDLNTWVDVYIPVIGGIIQSEYRAVWNQDIDEGKKIITLWKMYNRKLYEKRQVNKTTKYVMIPKEIYDKYINIFDEVIEKHKYKRN